MLHTKSLTILFSKMSQKERKNKRKKERKCKERTLFIVNQWDTDEIIFSSSMHAHNDLKQMLELCTDQYDECN